MADAFTEGFKSSSFYGKSVNDSLFSSLISHTPRIELSNNQSSSSKRSRSRSVESKKAKKAKISLFSGVKHGLKKPKPKKVDVKKYINTDSDMVVKSSKNKKKEQSSKENKPSNKQILVTPNKLPKSATKKSSNKKGKDENMKEESKSFRYHFEVTPEHMRVPKILPYSGFARATTSSKKGKKKLFSPDDEDYEEHTNNETRSKKLKTNKASPHNNKKTSPKKLFSERSEKCVATPKQFNQSPRSPKSAKKVIYETINVNDTPSPHYDTSKSSKKLTPKKLSARKSPRLATVVMKSPRANLNKPTPTKILDEPMHVDSPQVDRKTSTPCSTPMITRSSQKKLSLEQDTPKRTLSSKKKLFPKEDDRVPGEYFEKDVTADSFNVFDILNDSLDGIEMLDGSCGLMRENLFSPKKSPSVEQMNVSFKWDSSPEINSENQSSHSTFPKCREVESRNQMQTVNTFPRSTRASRKCVRQLTPNPRMYGSCKKTQKTAFALSQLQLSSPNTKLCPVCAYQGDVDDSEHLQVHSTVLKLKHYGNKQNETIVANYPEEGSRVVRVTSEEEAYWLQKANLVIEIADSELGFAESECSLMKNSQVYLYLNKQTIVGLAVVNPITCANRLISSTMNHSVDYASEEIYPACCGVSRIWVLKTYRRQQIATRLLDAVRQNFTSYNTIPKSLLAFSVPTSDGKFLAAKYIGQNDFLIFTELK